MQMNYPNLWSIYILSGTETKIFVLIKYKIWIYDEKNVHRMKSQYINKFKSYAQIRKITLFSLDYE